MMDEQYLLLEREMHKYGRGIWLVAVSRHWVLPCRRMTHRLDDCTFRLASVGFMYIHRY